MYFDVMEKLFSIFFIDIKLKDCAWWKQKWFILDIILHLWHMVCLSILIFFDELKYFWYIYVYIFSLFWYSVLYGILSVETYVQNFKVITLLLKAS